MNPPSSNLAVGIRRGIQASKASASRAEQRVALGEVTGRGRHMRADSEAARPRQASTTARAVPMHLAHEDGASAAGRLAAARSLHGQAGRPWQRSSAQACSPPSAE